MSVSLQTELAGYSEKRRIDDYLLRLDPAIGVAVSYDLRLPEDETGPAEEKRIADAVFGIWGHFAARPRRELHGFGIAGGWPLAGHPRRGRDHQ